MGNEITLKEHYKRKKTLERLARLDESAGPLVTEEIDRRFMATALNAVKRLQSIDFGPLTRLDNARDKAVLDVTKITSGESGPGILDRLMSMFRGQRSPIYDALAFGSAIANFFPLLSEYIEALASKGGKQIDTSATLDASLGGDELRDSMRKLVVSGLKPGRTLADLGKNWVKKYLENGLDDLAEQLMHASVEDIRKIAASVKQATTTVKQVSQEVPKQQEPEKTDDESQVRVKSAYTKIKPTLGDLSSDDRKMVANVLKVLDSNGLLK
jgi:hypothetical protein